MSKKRSNKPWKHVGGGCFVGGPKARLKYPCDDEYENELTGEHVYFDTTPEAHLSMPRVVEDLSELEQPGVRKRKHALDVGTN